MSSRVEDKSLLAFGEERVELHFHFITKHYGPLGVEALMCDLFPV